MDNVTVSVTDWRVSVLDHCRACIKAFESGSKISAELALAGFNEEREMRGKVEWARPCNFDPAAAIDLKVVQRKHGKLPERKRSERTIDAATFTAMRLLLLYGGTPGFNPADADHHYPILLYSGVNIYLNRLVADAGDLQEVEYSGGAETGEGSHYDLRLTNLRLVANVPGPYRRRAYRGRLEAIEISATCLEKLRARGNHRKGKLPTTQEYRSLMEAAFRAIGTHQSVDY